MTKGQPIGGSFFTAPQHQFLAADHSQHNAANDAIFKGWVTPFDGDDVASVTLYLHTLDRNTGEILPVSGFHPSSERIQWKEGTLVGEWRHAIPSSNLSATT